MKHTSGWLLLRGACLVSLLAMALPALPARAQTFAYVTNVFASTVSVIDTASNTVTSTVAVGSIPFGVAITPDGTRAYVANENSNSVSVIDTASNTVVAAVAVGSGPNWVAITPGIGPPSDKDQCKKGGWRNFTIPRKFKNQDVRPFCQ